ncbi:hypothetical protein EDB83DRAFT_1627723 [Lactarius deliciosus]|nr:hypothetical protein EDB83DRAFT_1627723 [Lactarius deliciosus]
MVAYCKHCSCYFSNLLAEHNTGKKHLRHVNVATTGILNPVTPHRPPPSPSNLPNSRPISLPSAPLPTISVPTSITSDPRVTVSHDNGIDFVIEGTKEAGRPSFSPVKYTILIEKTQVLSSLTVSGLILVRPTETPASCFTLSWSGETSAVRRKKPRRVLVSFQAPYAGTFRMSLQIVFSDNTKPSSKEFVILRELRGRATLLGRHVGGACPRMSFPRSSLVDYDAAISTEEEDASLDSESLDSQDTGVSVSDEDEVDFGIVGRNGLNGPFDTSSSSATINDAEGFPDVTFVEGRIRSWDDSGSRATFKGHSRTIHPGTESQQLGHFAVSRRLRTIAGSIEDHERLESLDQEGYIPRSGSGQQIPLEKIIPLERTAKTSRNLQYKLPRLVQNAVDSTTFKHPYNKKAPGLIAALKPKELTMHTYAEYFMALLNVEEGHQQ